jgi:aminopeptidase N
MNPSPPQERFLLRKSNDSTDPIVYQWWVPLTYTSDYQTNKRDWLSVDQVSKTLPNLGAAANQWVIFNIDQQSQYKLVPAILPSFNATFC